jgi:hypothetical protein
VEIDITAIGQQHTGAERGWLRQKGLFTGRVRGQNHSGRRITEQIHRGMEFDRRWLHDFEPSRKHLAQAIVDGKGAPVLNDDTAKRGKRLAFFEPEHFECHVADEPFCHESGEIGKVGLWPLGYRRLCKSRWCQTGH